jgi:hypothetical protein
MLNCKQFEDLLPELVDGGEWSAEQRTHGQSCQRCSSLVEDLRQIAQEAPELAAMHEPSPKVWQELRKSLVVEGIIRPQAKPGRLMDFFFSPRWRPALIPLGVAAMLVIVFVAYRSDSNPANMAQNKTAQVATADVAALLDDEDVQLLDDVSSNTPSLRASYEDNLKNANAYIQDAKATVANSPDSDEAREQLMQAYNQKAMVYEMAMNRSRR